MFLLILLFCVLGIIAYQDLRDREVFTILFPAVLLISSLKIYFDSGLDVLLVNTFGNTVLFILQILLVWLWLKIRKGKHIDFFKQYLGFGDILFYVCTAPLFNIQYFTIFFVGSLLFALAVWLLRKSKSKHQTIPLAGYGAIFLILMEIGLYFR